MFQNFRRLSKFAYLKKSLDPKYGVRNFCSAISQEESEKFKVILSSNKFKVSEDDIEDMFDYSASNVDDLSQHWDDAMKVVEKTEEIFPLQKQREEDFLKIRATQPTCTLASLVNESETLKSLVDLGVHLHQWDAHGHVDLIAKIDFKRDVVPLIHFLTDIGVDISVIGKILTFNPLLLEERMEDLKARVAYLVSKNFTKAEIALIVTKSPRWLSFSVRGIDARLGFFQKTFGFLGTEVRQLAVSKPTLIIWRGTPMKVKQSLFSINEEMGFTKEEIKSMVLKFPSLLKGTERADLNILNQFEILHNEAKIPHSIIAKFPESLIGRNIETKSRLEFLKALGRDQFDPDYPNFISPAMLARGTDAEFCEKAAKCSEEIYDRFLKTL